MQVVPLSSAFPFARMGTYQTKRACRGLSCHVPPPLTPPLLPCHTRLARLGHTLRLCGNVPNRMIGLKILLSFAALPSYFLILKFSHWASFRNLHHLPYSDFASYLQRHKIKCPSSAFECQSYELAQSRQWNLGFCACCSAAGVLLILAITHHPPIEVHQ